MPERILEERLPESMLERLQLDRRHPLIRLGQFAGALLSQQESRPERRDG